jgi:hypothetical protein
MYQWIIYKNVTGYVGCLSKIMRNPNLKSFNQLPAGLPNNKWLKKIRREQ